MPHRRDRSPQPPPVGIRHKSTRCAANLNGNLTGWSCDIRRSGIARFILPARLPEICVPEGYFCAHMSLGVG